MYRVLKIVKFEADDFEQSKKAPSQSDETALNS